MINFLETSPESPIIWSPGRPVTGSRRRPVDVPIYNFCIFVFPVKSSSRCVKQELLHLKNAFFSLHYQFFCWSPKSPLKVPWRSRTLEPLGNLQGTSPGPRVPAGIRELRCINSWSYWNSKTWNNNNKKNQERGFLGAFLAPLAASLVQPVIS